MVLKTIINCSIRFKSTFFCEMDEKDFFLITCQQATDVVLVCEFLRWIKDASSVCCSDPHICMGGAYGLQKCCFD